MKIKILLFHAAKLPMCMMLIPFVVLTWAAVTWFGISAVLIELATRFEFWCHDSYYPRYESLWQIFTDACKR